MMLRCGPFVMVAVLCAVPLLSVMTPTATAAPIDTFSGEISDWFLSFDPGTTNAILSFVNVTVQLDATAVPGYESYLATLRDIEIDRSSETLIAPSLYSYDLADAVILGGLVIEDGMGGQAVFDLRLGELIVAGHSTGFLSPQIGLDEITLVSNTSTIFDFTYYVLGGDMVVSLQVTGDSLLFALQNELDIRDGNRTSGSFSTSSAIPEPATMTLVAAGLGLAALRRRKAKVKTTD